MKGHEVGSEIGGEKGPDWNELDPQTGENLKSIMEKEEGDKADADSQNFPIKSRKDFRDKGHS